VDSNSEDSDSDMSDVGEVDSDLEREKHKNYERVVYKEDVAVVQQKKSMEDKASATSSGARKTAPPTGLHLQFVHG